MLLYSNESWLGIGFLIRILVIFVGDFIDKKFYPVQFTDIDYRVYSDAAYHVFNGDSPYERQTYRYPPILAIVLMGNIVYHPLFGKFLFAFFDTLIAYELRSIISLNKSIQTSAGKFWMIIWCLNPLSIYISCRGSVDSVSSWLVLRMLLNMLQHNYYRAAVLLGFSIYFRVYPVIFVPAFLGFIIFHNNQHYLRHRIVSAIKFLTLTFVTLGVSVWSSYAYYGQPYLDHAILYHFSRKDHRHNFSPMFYPIYLQYFHTNSSFDVDVFSTTHFIIQKLPLVCQCILLLATSICVKKLSLPNCMLILTMIFVSFNSVITGQYFLWYIVLFPVAFPKFLDQMATFFWPFAVLAVSLCVWLFFAYKLEFLGENTFLELWIASIVFLIAHGIVIVQCIVMSDSYH